MLAARVALYVALVQNGRAEQEVPQIGLHQLWKN